MLAFHNGGQLVEKLEELPDLTRSKRLYCDFETTCETNPREAAFSPWKGHRTAGICITADDAPGAWYIPIRHHFVDGTRHPGNLPQENVLAWLNAQIATCDEWVNHNVKFDAHFAAVDECRFTGRLVDTLTLAKLIDSDRLMKGGYGLKALSTHWLDDDIGSHGDRVQAFLDGVSLPRGAKAKAYGLVPPDILGEYGCQDVITNRKLMHHLEKVREADLAELWETEILLTPVLFDMEEEGMRVDPAQLQQREFQLLVALTKIEEQIEEIVGFTSNPGSNKDCFALLVTHFGLPVLKYNDEGNPSFDKDALKSYLSHPVVVGNDKIRTVVEAMLKYRKLHTLLSFFVQPYQEHQADGKMHPDFNQSVRSGRMSCKRPNAQQLSKAAKKLIWPDEGMELLSCDYSQVEFRIIVHILRDPECIAAYAKDPDTDFHSWVAEMCHIARDPAKNVNFAIGYGASKRKVTTMLAGNMDLMGELGGEVDRMIAEGHIEEGRRKSMFDELCRQRAEGVYNDYHDTLPGLQPTTHLATRRAISRGYVFNAYGRRLHLPRKAAHIAFNRVVQSTAADIIKERMVRLAPRYNSRTRELGLTMLLQVHDDLVFQGQDLKRPEVVKHVLDTMEDVPKSFRVPIRACASWSDESWGDMHDLPRSA